LGVTRAKGREGRQREDQEGAGEGEIAREDEEKKMKHDLKALSSIFVISTSSICLKINMSDYDISNKYFRYATKHRM
jgi:hypothetical protein